MKRPSLFLALMLPGLAVVGFAALFSTARKTYPYRLFNVRLSLQSDQHVNEIRDLIATASAHRLNGLVLSAGLDLLDLQPPAYLARLAQVRSAAENSGLELIPMIFSVGHGYAVLAHNKNLAAGHPVRDALFVTEGVTARLVPDPPVRIANGGFESYRGDAAAAYAFQDKPGVMSAVDRSVFKEGSASLRFENFDSSRRPFGRVMQEVGVRPFRCYRIRCWVRTEALEPRSAVHLQVHTRDGRVLLDWNPSVEPTNEWREIASGFNSLDYDTVRVYAGIWGGHRGRVWLDELRIEEVGLLNIVRRPGTPVSVRGEETGILYEEGRDYASLRDSLLDFRFDREEPVIVIPPGSRIRDGERLRVSYYHAACLIKHQVSVCMSEPEVYDIWRRQAGLIARHLNAKKFFLSMDEIRQGGWCEACRKRELSAAEILGDCISRQVDIIRDVAPGAEIFVWSDMLDPAHNAREKYYLFNGDFAGSWNFISKDLIVACWYLEKRRESLRHFSRVGFRTLAAAVTDAGSLEATRAWMEALKVTPRATGIMYTTWENRYAALGAFGDLVAPPREP